MVRKVTFDLLVFTRLMMGGSQFRIKKGLPADSIILDSEIRGNVIVLSVSSCAFQSTDPEELEIEVDEYLTRKRG